MDPDLLKCWRAEAKILIVDDEEFLVEIILEKLELEGFQTEGAGNGVEALERLSTFNADLVISDPRREETGWAGALARQTGPGRARRWSSTLEYNSDESRSINNSKSVSMAKNINQRIKC